MKPLDRDRLRPEPEPRTPAARPAAEPAEPVAFGIERAGERVDGLAPGGDPRWPARLRRGEIEVDRELDLHGMDTATARRALRGALDRARDTGERCLLVIHGRGLHSEGEAALKESLPGWLAAPPHGPRVLAFASAGPGRGGTGATYVLLRRKR